MAVLLVALAASPGSSSNWFGWKQGFNSIMRFDLCSLTSQKHSAWHEQNDPQVDGHWQLDETFLETRHFHLCDTTQEVEVRDYNHADDSRLGWWHCHEWANPNVCAWGHVHINLRYSYNDNTALTIMCHEVGHSVGLAHPSSDDPDTCMVTPVNNTKRHLRLHDVNLINNNYGS